LGKFLNGQELIGRYERNRAIRKKMMQDYFGIEDDHD